MSKSAGREILLALAALCAAVAPRPARGDNSGGSGPADPERYEAVPFGGGNGNPQIVQRYGIPFRERPIPIPEGGEAQAVIGGTAKRIFLLGMTQPHKLRAWAEARDYSERFFVGDELGRIRLDYANGSVQVFPLILGESIWWGPLFDRFPEPFPSDERLRRALADSLRLYPPAPVPDGNYVAVIVPQPLPIRSIALEDSSAKKGVPLIAGITVEPMAREGFAGAIPLAGPSPSLAIERFADRNALRPLGTDEGGSRMRLQALRRALYTSEENLQGPVPIELPRGYTGPRVSFKGDISAEILTNAFHANLQDIADKIGADGVYNTSTKGALSWGGEGFGTFRRNVGMYYGKSWSRDMGRSLQEFTELGFASKAAACADYALRMARPWETNTALAIKGTLVPRHWSRRINVPVKSECFENDGHGLIALFLYKLWQRLPNRTDWLRARWVDVKAAGDWIPWQFDHPEISGATEVLHTTGECAAGNGYSVYADAVCRNALLRLAEMADSIGERSTAESWRDRAEKMRAAIANRYVVNDPKYGRIWTLDFAGWPNQSTVLGPLIFLADDRGFAPEDDDPAWRPINEAAYRRLIDTYRPFGFYGPAMGYGQGFVTQSALLLDRMKDATEMLKWTAREIYDPRFGSFIVPEGCQIDPTGEFWYRTGDLGNGVQEAEVVKAMRIAIGVDDTQPDRLRFFPRMPLDWTEMAVERYPVLFDRSGNPQSGLLRFRLNRSGDRLTLEIAADREIGPLAIRLGPYAQPPVTASIRVDGRTRTATFEHSGDSWWTRLTLPVGLRAKRVEVGD